MRPEPNPDDIPVRSRRVLIILQIGGEVYFANRNVESVCCSTTTTKPSRTRSTRCSTPSPQATTRPKPTESPPAYRITAKDLEAVNRTGRGIRPCNPTRQREGWLKIRRLRESGDRPAACRGQSSPELRGLARERVRRPIWSALLRRSRIQIVCRRV